MTAGRVLVVLTEFVVLLAFASRFYFDKKLNDLSEVIDQKQTQIDAFAETEMQIRKVLAKQSAVNGYLQNNLGIIKRYDELNRITPSGIKLEKLSIETTGMNMTGQSESELGFAQFLHNLKQLPGIGRLSINDTNFDQTKGSVKFSILISFK